MEIVKRESEEAWTVEKEKSKNKFENNKRRQKVISEAKKIVEGVRVGDNELNELIESKNEYECGKKVETYARTTIGEDEKALLSLPPYHVFHR